MRPDLVIVARAFVRGEFVDAEIGIDSDSGRIVAVKRNLAGEPRKRYPGRLLVPSGVDLHVHFRDPGAPKKEDFGTGTRGAALGGVGTVVDMPNTSPIVDRLSRLQEKADAVRAKACVDWGLWATLTPQTTKAPDLLKAAHGLKLYLAPTTGVPDPGSQADLRTRLALAHQARRLVALHAERAVDHPVRDLATHDASRTPEGERETILAAAEVSTSPDSIHVAHASTAQTLSAAGAAGFTAGVTPHHLLLAFNEGDLGARGKTNPPLRHASKRASLWEALARGEIPILESDHAPHTLDEKALPFPEAPAGVPGVETGFPLLLYEARRRRVDLAHVIRGYAQHPAQRLGLRKGRIEPGYDADFFLFDPAQAAPLRGPDLASRCGWTPFEGWPSFRVETHYLHGEVVVEDHEFVGSSGRGRNLGTLGAPSPLSLEGPARSR